jgi:hypothetical protein
MAIAEYSEFFVESAGLSIISEYIAYGVRKVLCSRKSKEGINTQAAEEKMPAIRGQLNI